MIRLNEEINKNMIDTFQLRQFPKRDYGEMAIFGECDCVSVRRGNEGCHFTICNAIAKPCAARE